MHWQQEKLQHKHIYSLYIGSFPYGTLHLHRYFTGVRGNLNATRYSIELCLLLGQIIFMNSLQLKYVQVTVIEIILIELFFLREFTEYQTYISVPLIPISWIWIYTYPYNNYFLQADTGQFRVNPEPLFWLCWRTQLCIQQLLMSIELFSVK